MIFQDPVNAFNPSFTIGSQLRRVLKLHRARASRAGGYDAEIVRMLARVGIDARGKLDSYPFNFSQGQLQRIMIAAACLGGKPSLLLADEPTTSLDVTIEAQVLQLLRDLRRELGLALILVTHNLALVAELCDRVLVMYAGRLVEDADVYQLFESPSSSVHAQLLRAIPTFPNTGERLYAMRGNVPDLARALQAARSRRAASGTWRGLRSATPPYQCLVPSGAADQMAPHVTWHEASRADRLVAAHGLRSSTFR